MRLFLFILPFAFAGFLFGWWRVARAGREGRLLSLTWPLPLLILVLTPLAVVYLLLTTGSAGGDDMRDLAIILVVTSGLLATLASWVGAVLGVAVTRRGLR